MQNIIKPQRLRKGDTIGFIAPSKHLSDDDRFIFKRTTAILQQLGFNLKTSSHFFAVDRYGYSAGTAEERAADIMEQFSDDSITGIWCWQGGQTANMVLDLLDYEFIEKHPKLFLGFSDNTVLLNAMYQKTGLITFHAPDPKVYPQEEPFASEYSQAEFINRLVNAEAGQIRKKSNWKVVRSGQANGKLFGGNLRSLLKLAGTPYWPEVVGAILLLEDNHIDIPEAEYMLTRLRHMGVFEKVSAVVVGYIYGFQHRYNRVVQFEDILLEISRDFTFPILKINEFGHKCHNTFLPIGGEAYVNTEKLKFALEPCISS